jgi:hypothetical protein
MWPGVEAHPPFHRCLEHLSLEAHQTRRTLLNVQDGLENLPVKLKLWKSNQEVRKYYQSYIFFFFQRRKETDRQQVIRLAVRCFRLATAQGQGNSKCTLA